MDNLAPKNTNAPTFEQSTKLKLVGSFMKENARK
jgi:hypothetical protein